MRQTPRALFLPLAGLFLLAQLLLAWHAPSHLTPEEDGPLQLISTADCEICLPAQGAAPIPAFSLNPPEHNTSPAPVAATQPAIKQITIPGAGPRAPPVFS